MKTKFITLPLFFIVCYTSIFAQESISEKIIEPLQENILYREKVFLHLNKSVYFTNETIWLTAYVAEDAENKPSVYSSNLIVNLIDFEGNVIQQKTILIQNGVGNSDFLLDNNLASGKYFIQGFTNYMRNFGKENMFIQEIEIINSPLEENINNQEYTNSYDIQIFPESGYLLENVENTVGIKALINGKGFPFSGEIKNSNGAVVSAFTGNELGMGKSKFTYSENEVYTAIIKINNTTQKVELPKANKTGVIFSLDNTDDQELIVTLKTNIQTLPSLQNTNLSLLFYRNNYISHAASLSLINNEQTTQELIFDKSKLLNGVNIVTLFKDNQPIAERKFFVDKLSEQTAVLFNKLKTENDSTSFKIKTININLKPAISQLSISVLPKNAKNFHDNQTIESAFLLTPYVKGEIENPSYYFENSTPTIKVDLDALLLNQGWSTYSLEEKIKEVNPIEHFKFESGFTLNGKIKWSPKGSTIGILSKNGGLDAYSEINNDRQFSFENMFVFKNDSIKVALIRDKKPLQKPTNVSFIKDTTSIKNFNFITNKLLQNPIIKAEINSEEEASNISNFNKYPNVEVLEQVVLKTVKSKRKRTFYDDEMDLASKHRIIASGFYDNHKVTEKMETSFVTPMHYLQSLGYVNNDIIKLRHGVYSLISSTPTRVFIDDIEVEAKNLKYMTMVDVDEILINRTGAGGGIEGAGGIVKIYLKKGNHKYYKYGNTLYKDLISLIGYDKATNYFNPQYDIYTQDAYNWTEIDWINNLQTNENGEVIIKIPTNEFSNEYQFIINGFSENGLLFNAIYKTGSNNF